MLRASVSRMPQIKGVSPCGECQRLVFSMFSVILGVPTPSYASRSTYPTAHLDEQGIARHAKLCSRLFIGLLAFSAHRRRKLDTNSSTRSGCASWTSQLLEASFPEPAARAVAWRRCELAGAPVVVVCFFCSDRMESPWLIALKKFQKRTRREGF